MLKRLFELAIVILAAPLWVPLMAVVALLTAIIHGRPVLFSQPRGGLGGKVFDIYKFRTMTDERGADGALLPDHERLTRFGRFLRASSLDELPSILNFLKGDIALVGPRPFMAQYLPLYSPEQARRHEVRPGITGWAQVKGRNSLSWEEKFALDIWYVENRSLWLDIRILFLTVAKVFGGEGVSQEGHVTMPLFEGTRRDR
jgi:sugar transferase EpsL